MNFFKTTFYTSVSTAITFICGFIVAKVVAVKIGPEGIAMVGQFQNTVAIFSMLGTGAINMGVVKYLSQNLNNKEQQNKILNNAFLIVIVSSLSISAVVMLASSRLSNLAFHTSDYWLVYLLFGAFLIFTSLNLIFTSVFNGLQEIKKLTVSNIFTSVSGIIFTVLFAYTLQVKGVLMAANATALVVFAINIFLFKKIPLSFRFSFRGLDRTILKSLLGFSVMSATSAFVLPSAQLLVRDKIISNLSIEAAGYWQAVTKISDYYLAFITTVLSVYYLPRLSQITDQTKLRNEITKGYKIILPVVGLLALSIWLFRHLIILVLFSPKFLPMKSLFTFQLIGDFLKISSWLLGFLMWAKAMVKTFIVTEISFTIIFVFLSYFFIDRFGLVGATYAFALNYFLYALTIFFLFRALLFEKH